MTDKSAYRAMKEKVERLDAELSKSKESYAKLMASYERACARADELEAENGEMRKLVNQSKRQNHVIGVIRDAMELV